MNLLNRTHEVFTKAKARENAAILNADEDDDFTYVVVVNPNPNGLDTAIIEVYDDEDILIALV